MLQSMLERYDRAQLNPQVWLSLLDNQLTGCVYGSKACLCDSRPSLINFINLTIIIIIKVSLSSMLISFLFCSFFDYFFSFLSPFFDVFFIHIKLLSFLFLSTWSSFTLYNALYCLLFGYFFLKFSLLFVK